MGNSVHVLLSRTNTHIPNGGRISPKSISIGIKIFPYPNPNREIPHGLLGGSPMTPLIGVSLLHTNIQEQDYQCGEGESYNYIASDANK
jgi:hypothetical protein